ncbi:cytosolic serine hydroxymethyltransferase [Rozella allomycis CSF55]|uniref:Serine hydroxymethyltransferase n=1 Tax=Rozella allomycis (strain CSF55) TaxID=988480 RepID=A0A075APN5_ROZAC|nr:Serine hydroxymethyltransferase 2, mitochondrial [Rozella allomycis CSF55]RKP20102.1 cytosolic serine hydroxymethyltransferase [Rozella allomycis CSF55]|eukprot:EPZ32076.1 Serine hydroxymethyltransferase 2, mitochondrial [Rozella allomycis CSF55]
MLIKRLFSTNITNLNLKLQSIDPEIYSIIENEKKRQQISINLIPSENYTSKAVMEALGSPMQNKYSEGYPGTRYYGGNEYIDMAERLCQKRALETFGLDPEKWGVNVQSLSGAPANFYVYSALMKPHDRLMGLDLPHGGHLSHGYQTENKKISMVSTYFETMPYRLDEKNGLINYDELELLATRFRPKIIIAGASAYSRLIDYERMSKIAARCNAYLMADIAHLSGMIAAGVIPSPFEYSDVVTTTTHKSLRGPRGAMIFFRRGEKGKDKKGNVLRYDLEDKINFSVFPGHQGALKQAQSNEFREYQEQVIENALILSNRLKEKGYKIVSDGTDTHLLLLDLTNKNIDGARVERVLELAKIATNKNTVPGDVSALLPRGLRMGTPAMTTRGFKSNDFKMVADFVDRGIQIAQMIANRYPTSNKLKEFNKILQTENIKEISQLEMEVVDFASKFPTVGYEI